MKWWLTFVAAVTAAAALGVASAEGAAVRKAHPRIFFTDEVIAGVKEKIANEPIVAEAYAKLKARADGADITETSWTVHDQVTAVALTYLVEGKDPRYLAILKTAMEELPKSKPSSWTDGFTTQALSIAYDATYNALTPAERGRYAKGITEVSSRIWKYYRHSDYNNHVYIEYGPLVYAGLALANDGYEPETAKKCLDWGEDFLKNHGTRAFAQVGGKDGGWHESRSYHSLFTHFFVHQLEAWRTATGEDLFPLATGLAGDARWMVHTNLPHDMQPCAAADINTSPNTERTPSWNETFYYLPILAREYRDGVAQYWGKRGFDDYAFRNWAFIIGYDPTVEPIPPEEMPTAQVFENLGWVAMRSDWSKEATFANFMCGRYFAGHEHMDKNAFVIHKQGTLAIDAGEYGAKATESHNTILIGGNQRPFGNDPFRYVEAIEPGHPGYTGHIVAYETNDSYTYVCGDATAAYPADRVKLFTRQFVYLRPDLFVIYDRTESNGKQPRKWMLHSLEPAQLQGDEAVIANLNGKLLVKMLLPEGVSSRQYQMVAARDEPGYSQKNKDRKDNYIVFEPRGQEERQDFLTVLYAVGKGTPEMKSCERIEKGGNPGARVVIGDTTYEVTFATAGEPAGHVTITGAGRSVDADLARDIRR